MEVEDNIKENCNSINEIKQDAELAEIITHDALVDMSHEDSIVDPRVKTEMT